MRGKRSKAYKKLMGAYHQTFGFREPYQVLLDSEMIKEATKCTMEIPPALERTLRGKVKPLITQCSIRHLYALSAAENPSKERFIDIAKSFERRKCNHHELEEPLPEKECFESVAIKNGQNKHRYVIASQDREIRGLFREIPGVPSIIINRSVMILEPMNEASKSKRDGMEREKFLKGIVDVRAADKALRKRKREDEEDGENAGSDGVEEGAVKEKKKKKKKGPKGPNPLSVKKSTKKPDGSSKPPKKAEGDPDGQVKKRRKRKHGKGGDGAGQEAPAEGTSPIGNAPAED
ncbi:hypothetical protein K440DRAFT_603089 [Wilcoxina mikolae CBS 423.85]|nr:hypothetical protein K440DRAFT_603089 [Wilcoxina mikolae CBS 423.85]